MTTTEDLTRPDPTGRPTVPRPSGRPVLTVLTVVVLLALAGGAGFLVGRHSSTTATVAAGSSAVTAAQQVQACERQHGMSFQRTEHSVAVPERYAAGSFQAAVQFTPTGEEFDACSWPPTAGADADGFSHVASYVVTGPGTDEASDATIADQIVSPCHAVRVVLDHGIQGVGGTATYVVTPGTWTEPPTGARWTPGTQGLPFYLTTDEAVVLSNDAWTLQTATCA